MSDLPKISIVTPCFNQVKYIEKTLQSIHGQGYENLEHIVMDGGSTDGSLEIIKNFRSGNLRWTSGPDDGQYHAIETGLNSASGEILAWLNSDDVYLPGTLRVVGEIFRELPDVEWLTTRFPIGVDHNGAIIKIGGFPGFSRDHFRRGDYLPACGWEAMGFIQQESTFWRRSLWERAGASFDRSLNYAGDFELWSRFFEVADLYGVDVPLGCFRRHDEQKTSVAFERYLLEAKKVFAASRGVPPSPLFQKIRVQLLGFGGTSYKARSVASKVGLLRKARNITYDWQSQRWVRESLG